LFCESRPACGPGISDTPGLTTVLDIKIKMFPCYAAGKPVAMIRTAAPRATRTSSWTAPARPTSIRQAWTCGEDRLGTSKGVIQGYAAQAAVDASHQVIVAADVIGSGSEQTMLLPMIGHAQTVANEHTVMTADAGFHSRDNMRALKEAGIPSLVADGQMRKRDERFPGQQRHREKSGPLHDKTRVQEKPVRLFRPEDFILDAEHKCCICPADRRLYSSGSRCRMNGCVAHKYKGMQGGCGTCTMRAQCLRYSERTPVRQVAIFASGSTSSHAATELMKRAIDSARGRAIYSQRIAIVEPVFPNIRHTKRLDRFTLAGQGEGWHAMAAVLLGAQHREAGAQSERGRAGLRSACESPARACQGASGCQNASRTQNRAENRRRGDAKDPG